MFRARSTLFFLVITGSFLLPSLCRADSAIYIFHGMSEELTPANGTELVCLGKAPKFRSCQAARTTDGVVKKAVKVAPREGLAFLRKYLRLLKVTGGNKCRGSLSFSTEWDDEKITRALCPSEKRDRELTHVLLKVEHAITGMLEP
jgi:hypothetical protein